MIYAELFLGFLKVGLFAFGGAYGAIPLIRDVVLSYGWLTDDALTRMIAVSESTPGPIMVNLATYVGASQAGVFGALFATLAVVLPSFVIILLVMALLKTALKNRYVQAALRGIKPAVIGIVLATGAFLLVRELVPLEEKTDWRDLALTAILAILFFAPEKIFNKKLSPIMLICIAAALGAVTYTFIPA